jgi:cyclophilin family peptidyl-prolyl cis-trans isomerase
LQLSRAIYDPNAHEKGAPISYKDTEIHRICPGMFVQGGKIKGVEHGKSSVFGQEFEDESFHMKHSEIG